MLNKNSDGEFPFPKRLFIDWFFFLNKKDFLNPMYYNLTCLKLLSVQIVKKKILCIIFNMRHLVKTFSASFFLVLKSMTNEDNAHY